MKMWTGFKRLIMRPYTQRCLAVGCSLHVTVITFPAVTKRPPTELRGDFSCNRHWCNHIIHASLHYELLQEENLASFKITAWTVIDWRCIKVWQLRTDWLRAVRTGFDAGQVQRFSIHDHIQTDTGDHPESQWLPGVLAPRVKRPGREGDHSPPCSP
jgi:hypothetical protein